jgi:hypothetical protein
VSSWLHRVGLEIRQGQHRVPQANLNYSQPFLDLFSRGPKGVVELLEERIWGLRASPKGKDQLKKFCDFLALHKAGTGVLECARILGVHRSSIAEWRAGSDQPYLAKFAGHALVLPPADSGWKFLPLRLDSGGNESSGWISVPQKISCYDDVSRVISQTKPLENAIDEAESFGIRREELAGIRPELFAYALGMLLGDAGKSGGQQERFASMSVDLQLSQRERSNQILGRFVCMTFQSFGVPMRQVRDKQPSGDTRNALEPFPSFRWSSERSPLVAWMFCVGLGMPWNTLTSYNPVHMDWILNSPTSFQKRFVQAISDSDGGIKDYGVVITSVPNAEFITSLLKKMGLETAHTVVENGVRLRTYVNAREAAKLPLFNEYAKSYRYKQLQRFV